MKIYSQLRLIWLSLLVSAVPLLLAPIESETLSVLSNLLSLASRGVIAFALSRIAAESQRFNRAFINQLLSFILLTLGMIGGRFVSSPEGMLDTFTTLLSICGTLFALLAEYQLFWALDERIIPCGYAYPARRIRWCFYTPLLGAVLGSAIATALLVRMYASATPEAPVAAVLPAPVLWVITAVSLLSQAIVFALFFQYNRAVRDREQDSLAG